MHFQLQPLDNSNLTITEDEANELKMIREEQVEEGFDTLEESSISFLLNGPNEELSQED